MDPSDEEESADVVERPDGYYWVADDGTEVGPFASYEAAEADRDNLGDEVPEPGESVEEAEAELGINQWVDSETGEPAEGQSPPHLDPD
jgi:hypothetical protein